MKTIEELLRFSDITPSEEYAITEVFEDYEKQINALKEENTWLLEELTVQKNVRISFENAHKKLLEEKAKLIEENKNLIQAGFKESISADKFKKECLNEPEPEESQKELESEENIMQDLLIDYREMRKRGSTYFSIALCLLDKYSIQRKK